MTPLKAIPKSICILRLSAIGDVCHALATVQQIQARFPQVEITWVIGKLEYQLMKELVEVNWVVFDKKQGLSAYRRLYQQFKGRSFDVLLHMQVALRASIASLCIPAKQKWGFDSGRAKEGQWLFTNRKIGRQNEPHVAEGFWAFAKAIGATEQDKPEWQAAAIKPYSLAALLDDPMQPVAVISPAASNPDRNWLSDRYATIAGYLAHKNYQVVLTGGPSHMEKNLAQSIVTQCKAPVINLVGKTTLVELLSIIQQAKLVIAPDSGPAHMACLVDTPVIGLYAHSNPQRTGPYKSQHLTLSVYAESLLQQTGKNIAQNKWGKRVKGADLMQKITCEQVIEKIEQLLPF